MSNFKAKMHLIRFPKVFARHSSSDVGMGGGLKRFPNPNPCFEKPSYKEKGQEGERTGVRRAVPRAYADRKPDLACTVKTCAVGYNRMHWLTLQTSAVM